MVIATTPTPRHGKVRIRIGTTLLVGAHVSTQGGVHLAPERARSIGGSAVQVFTKTPNQWKEPEVPTERCQEFRAAMLRHRQHFVCAHDSYLINLASPDPVLRRRSEASFMAELARCTALGIGAIVSHPGNFIDDEAAGLARNAESLSRCLDAVESDVRVLLETTAGCGTALGRTFSQLAQLRDLLPSRHRHRVAFCADTCHLYSAGYDLVGDFDGVWAEWERTLGMDSLGCLHLNDSKTPFASRRDRHELLGQGSLGAAVFRRIMTDSRFAKVPRILETPKGDDMVTNDRRTIRRLKRYARAGTAVR